MSYEKKNLKTLQSNCCFALEYWSGLVLLFLWDNDNILVGRCWEAHKTEQNCISVAQYAVEKRHLAKTIVLS